MFQQYESATIFPQQIDQFVIKVVTWINIRDFEQYENQTISGAIHSKWQQVIKCINEIPSDRKLIVFYNTGSLPAPAALALRVAGFDNVVVMQSNLLG